MKLGRVCPIFAVHWTNLLFHHSLIYRQHEVGKEGGERRRLSRQSLMLLSAQFKFTTLRRLVLWIGHFYNLTELKFRLFNVRRRSEHVCVCASFSVLLFRGQITWIFLSLIVGGLFDHRLCLTISFVLIIMLTRSNVSFYVANCAACFSNN